MSALETANVYGVVFRFEWGRNEVELGGQGKVFGDVRDLESVSRLLCRLKHEEVHQNNYFAMFGAMARFIFIVCWGN